MTLRSFLRLILTLQETNPNLDEIVQLAKQLQVSLTFKLLALSCTPPFCITLFAFFLIPFKHDLFVDSLSYFALGVFENAVNRGVQNISFGDLSGNLGRTMY
jgi:hypothetical protein